jgi:hypothetical protein
MFSYLEHELSIPSKSNAERSYQVGGLHKKKVTFKNGRSEDCKNKI